MRNAVYTIRRSGLMDLDSLEEIERECFLYGKFSRSVLTGFLRHPFSVTLVAESERIFASEIIVLHNGSLEIASIAVIPEMRRMGVASSLLRQAEQIGAAKGVAKITLHVDTGNLGAIELYRREGYRVETTVYDYYGSGKDAIYMVKDIDAAGGVGSGGTCSKTENRRMRRIG